MIPTQLPMAHYCHTSYPRPDKRRDAQRCFRTTDHRQDKRARFLHHISTNASISNPHSHPLLQKHRRQPTSTSYPTNNPRRMIWDNQSNLDSPLASSELMLGLDTLTAGPNLTQAHARLGSRIGHGGRRREDLNSDAGSGLDEDAGADVDLDTDMDIVRFVPLLRTKRLALMMYGRRLPF
jgi:hypothetical protein